MLLFDIDLNEPDATIQDNNFAAATTQDGRRVWVLEHFVSRNGPSPTLWLPENPHQVVIFNDDQQLCRLRYGCTNTNDEIFISAGSIYEVHLENEEDQEENDLLRLENTHTTENLTVFLTRRRLENLNNEGVLTNARLQHPRYDVEVQESSRLLARCGSNFQREHQGISDIDQIIVEAFRLGEWQERSDGSYFLSTDHEFEGQDGVEIRHKVFFFHANREDEEDFYIVSQVIYGCRSLTVFGGHYEYRRMISVSIYDSRNDRTFRLSSFGTPDNLYQHTNSAYLFSVNSTRHYFDLLAILSDEERFQNRAVAGYFLAEFNRSCSEEDRRNVNLCTRYSIREQRNIPDTLPPRDPR